MMVVVACGAKKLDHAAGARFMAKLLNTQRWYVICKDY
jgi:hypothetical protein